VLVNPAHAEVIPELRALFPDIAIESYTNVGRLPDVQGAPTGAPIPDAVTAPVPTFTPEFVQSLGFSKGSPITKAATAPAGVLAGKPLSDPAVQND